MPSADLQPKHRLALALAAGAGIAAVAGPTTGLASGMATGLPGGGPGGHHRAEASPSREASGVRRAARAEVHTQAVSAPVVFTLPGPGAGDGASGGAVPGIGMPGVDMVDTTPPPKPAPAPAPAAPAPAPRPRAAATSQGGPDGGQDLGTFLVTCYALHGQTASGTQAGPQSAAVDPSVIPLGTHLVIDGVGLRVADDTGGAVRGRHIDIWESSEHACADFGRRYLHVRRAS